MKIGRALAILTLYPIFYVVSAVDIPDGVLGSTEMTYDHSSSPRLTTTNSPISRLREIRNHRINAMISSSRFDATGFGTPFRGEASASRPRRQRRLDMYQRSSLFGYYQSETLIALSRIRRQWETTGTSNESGDDRSGTFTSQTRRQRRLNMDEGSSVSDDGQNETLTALSRIRRQWETTGMSNESGDGRSETFTSPPRRQRRLNVNEGSNESGDGQNETLASLSRLRRQWDVTRTSNESDDDRSEIFTSPSHRQRQLNMRHSSSEVVDHLASENQSYESGPLLFGFMPKSVLTESLTQKKGTENKITLQTGIEILESIPKNQRPIAMKQPPSQISALKVLDENRSRCAICLEDYQPPKKNENGEWIFETIRQFGPCEHYYHPGCVQRLFEAQKRRVCPMCRSTGSIQ